MILHLLRMRRNVNRNVFNDRKIVSATLNFQQGSPMGKLTYEETYITLTLNQHLINPLICIRQP